MSHTPPHVRWCILAWPCFLLSCSSPGLRSTAPCLKLYCVLAHRHRQATRRNVKARRNNAHAVDEVLYQVVASHGYVRSVCACMHGCSWVHILRSMLFLMIMKERFGKMQVAIQRCTRRPHWTNLASAASTAAQGNKAFAASWVAPLFNFVAASAPCSLLHIFRRAAIRSRFIRFNRHRNRKIGMIVSPIYS